MKFSKYTSLKQSQSGAVLIVSLIVLLLLTILSVGTAKNTLLQEKMTFAVNDANLALKSAELAIIDAENRIDGWGVLVNFLDSGDEGLYTTDNAPTDLTATEIWAEKKTIDSASRPDPHLEYPRYFIEHLGMLDEDAGAGSVNILNYGQSSGSGGLHAFRIVARGIGKSANSQRIIVSYFAKSL